MKKLLLPLLLALSLMAALPSFAQDSTAYNSLVLHDKLSLHIYTASVMQKGQLQLDIDYSLEQFSHPVGWRMTTGSLPELQARYGLFKNVEARIGTRLGYFDNNRFNDYFHGKTYVDLFSIGVKATLHRYNNQKGNLALIAESNAPLIRLSNVGLANRFIPSLTLINENSLNSWLGYTLNARATYWVWEQELVSFNLAASANFYHNPRTISFIGLSGFHNHSYSNTPTFSVNTGFIYSPAHNLQLRTGFNLKLNDYNPNVAGLGGTIGMAWQPNFSRAK